MTLLPRQRTNSLLTSFFFGETNNTYLVAYEQIESQDTTQPHNIPCKGCQVAEDQRRGIYNYTEHANEISAAFARRLEGATAISHAVRPKICIAFRIITLHYTSSSSVHHSRRGFAQPCIEIIVYSLFRRESESHCCDTQ